MARKSRHETREYAWKYLRLTYILSTLTFYIDLAILIWFWLKGWDLASFIWLILMILSYTAIGSKINKLEKIIFGD